MSELSDKNNNIKNKRYYYKPNVTNKKESNQIIFENTNIYDNNIFKYISKYINIDDINLFDKKYSKEIYNKNKLMNLLNLYVKTNQYKSSIEYNNYKLKVYKIYLFIFLSNILTLKVLYNCKKLNELKYSNIKKYSFLNKMYNFQIIVYGIILFTSISYLICSCNIHYSKLLIEMLKNLESTDTNNYKANLESKNDMEFIYAFNEFKINKKYKL